MFNLCCPKRKDHDDCAICLIKLNKNWTQTSCGHRFHQTCINAWSTYQTKNHQSYKCPMCNTIMINK